MESGTVELEKEEKKEEVAENSKEFANEKEKTEDKAPEKENAVEPPVCAQVEATAVESVKIDTEPSETTADSVVEPPDKKLRGKKPKTSQNSDDELRKIKNAAGESLKNAFASFNSLMRVILPKVGGFLCNVSSLTVNTAKHIVSKASGAVDAAAVGFLVLVSHDLSVILPALIAFLYKIGHAAWMSLCSIASMSYRLVSGFISAVFGTILGWFAKKLKQPLYDVWCAFLTPFAHAYGGAADAAIHFNKSRKKGVGHAFMSVLTTLYRLMIGIGEVLRFAFNYIAPAVCIVFLIALIKYANTLQYTISLEYNGNRLGTIENEAAYNEAATLMQDKITYVEDEKPVIATPKFTVTMMNPPDGSEQNDVTDSELLSELLIETGDANIVYAYGFYINDELIGVYSEEDMEIIRTALENRLAMYTTANTATVSFADKVEISQGRFIDTVLVSPENALDIIEGQTSVEAYYEVARGDSVSKICSNLGITREEFEMYNPTLANGVKRGDIVTYYYYEPTLDVITTHYEVYDQVIERTTVYDYTSRYEKGCEVLKQHGSDGYENVTALVTEKNGRESKRTIISRTVIEEMVPRIFRAGTKENTYLNGNTKVLDTLGTFVWPLGDDGGYISSLFGYRSWDSSNHGAVDIAGIPSGTDIYAACDGTVVFSGTKGAYGKLVIIDHGHGYETYYGHCSELDVSVGDVVEKGDVIAHVGMTGNTSGYHLHFEMRYNDKRIDPLIALGGTGGHRIWE